MSHHFPALTTSLVYNARCNFQLLLTCLYFDSLSKVSNMKCLTPFGCILLSCCFLSKSPVSEAFGKRSSGGGYGGDIELCQCPNIPAPIKYVAVEVPKPVRVTTIPAPSNQMSGIPVVLPDKGDDGGYWFKDSRNTSTFRFTSMLVIDLNARMYIKLVRTHKCQEKRCRKMLLEDWYNL